MFVAGLGTSGTLMGTGRYLREHKPGVRIVAAEPLPGEKLTGPAVARGRASCPRSSTRPCSTRSTWSPNRDAVAALRDLVAKEGVFAGPSSGAVLVAAAREAQRMEAGTIVALLPDGGWKYLSAGTFDRDLDDMEDDLEGGVSWW